MSTATHKPFTQTNASVLLDAIRGAAALIVFAGHWRNIFFIDYSQLPAAQRKWVILPYLLCSAGHQAVVIFFVLSGYFITSSILRSRQKGFWSWSSYLTHRLVRLWIVVIPGLLLCTLWDKLGIALNRAPLLYGGANYNHVTGNVHAALTPAAFLGNFFFLQGVVTPVYGSDGPLWSLANEFWYYILFPLGLIALAKRSPLVARIICAVLFVAISLWLLHSLLPSFGIWLLGAALTVIPNRPQKQWLQWIAAFVLIAALYGASRFSLLQGVWSDYALGIVTTAIVWVFLGNNSQANPNSFFTHAARETSRFSFSLYVLHVPLVVFAASLLVHDSRWAPTPLHIAMAVGVLLLTALYAWAIASVTEFHTDKVRVKVEQALHVGRHWISSPHEKELR